MRLTLAGIVPNDFRGWVIAVTLIGMVLLAAFVRFELRTENPLLQLRICPLRTRRQSMTTGRRRM